MGTQWSVVLAGSLTEARRATLHQLIERRLTGLCDEMSHWQTNSLISKLNRAGTGWYALPPDFHTVLATAIEVARLSAGNYDPTLGELVNLWGFGPVSVRPEQIPPDQAHVAQALQRCGWQQTLVNSEHRAVWQPGNVQFDLSSIAKGYAVDCIAMLLAEHDVSDYLVEIGGELRACGVNARGKPWQVLIETPLREDTVPGLPLSCLPSANCMSHLQAKPRQTNPQSSKPAPGIALSLNNLAVASSGNYRRVLPGSHSRYWHTLSPFTGKPVEHTLASVSVVHRQCMMADALATALLVMGPEQGYEFALQHAIAAIFMSDENGDGRMYWTPEFERWTC